MPNHRVAILPFPDIPGAYLCLSGQERPRRLHGERWFTGHKENRNEYSEDYHSKPNITFVFDAGNCCAEWDGELGPIQLWWKAKEGWKSEDEWELAPGAEPHYFYDFAYGRGHWSQLSVEEERLPHKFVSGDYKGIFQVLSQWATARNGDYPEAREGLGE
jgi:hypothetical protein